MYPSLMEFGGAFYWVFREGFPTWSEGLLIWPLRGEFNFRGMLYERKFHYIRGLQFGNTDCPSNWPSYTDQFVATCVIDAEMKKASDGKASIYELFACLWRKYHRHDRSLRRSR